jgi:hypothetical protein
LPDDLVQFGGTHPCFLQLLERTARLDALMLPDVAYEQYAVSRVAAKSVTHCVPTAEQLAWLFLLFLAALGQEFLRPCSLSCLDLAKENRELILCHFVAAQQRFQSVHQEHLNPNKLCENVKAHSAVTLTTGLCEKSLTNPLADALPLSHRERFQFAEFIARDFCAGRSSAHRLSFSPPSSSNLH